MRSLMLQRVQAVKDGDVDGDAAVGRECSGFECDKHVAGNVSSTQTSETDEGVCIDVEPHGSSSVQMTSPSIIRLIYK